MIVPEQDFIGMELWSIATADQRQDIAPE